MPNADVKSFTKEQVAAALNRAASEITDAAALPDEGTRDALNLLVNATLDYLSGEAVDLEGVAAGNYDLDLAEIVSWIRS